MNAGIFGWSYPPGCSGPPDEDYDDRSTDESADAELIEQCDPYGSLEFAIGTGDDFVCFDYAVDTERQRIALAATVNSETGSFIQNFREPWVGPLSEAPREAARMVSEALDWCGDNDIRPDMKGWNQDPAYFYRRVRRVALKPSGRPPARRHRKWFNDFMEAFK
jgi:hypothetical protein